MKTIKTKKDRYGTFVEAILEVKVTAYLKNGDIRDEISLEEAQGLIDREKEFLASSNDGSEALANAKFNFK